MKYYLITCLLVCHFSFSNKTKEKDVLGKWTLQIQLKEQLKDASKDLNLFEKIVIGSVSGLVESVMEEIEITFEFKKNQVLLLHVEVALDEKQTEIEQLTWHMDADGKIFIDDVQNDRVKIDTDGYWKLMAGKLVAYDENDELEKNVFMTRKL